MIAGNCTTLNYNFYEFMLLCNFYAELKLSLSLFLSLSLLISLSASLFQPPAFRSGRKNINHGLVVNKKGDAVSKSVRFCARRKRERERERDRDRVRDREREI
jgi:hypothetical protein